MADLPNHHHEQTGNPQLDRIQANVRKLISMLRNIPFLWDRSLVPYLWGGKLISVTFASAGTEQIIQHNLGVPAACFVVRENYNSLGAMNKPAFAESVPQPTTIDPTTHLALIASAVCSVDLWFYPRASKEIDSVSHQSPGWLPVK